MYVYNTPTHHDDPLNMARFRRSLIQANTCFAESMTSASSLGVVVVVVAVVAVPLLWLLLIIVGVGNVL